MIVASYIILILALIGLDQWLKTWVTLNIAIGSQHDFIPKLMNLTNLHNNGAAWSIFEGQQWFFFIITIIVVAILVYYMRRYKNHWLVMTALSLVMAGTLGNFIDRLCDGYVVDMFELLPINFPVFNLADCYLTIGVIWLIIIIIREGDERERKTNISD